jgi:hypothetical protein
MYTKCEGKRSLERKRHRQKDNIIELEYEVVDPIHVA